MLMRLMLMRLRLLGPILTSHTQSGKGKKAQVNQHFESIIIVIAEAATQQRQCVLRRHHFGSSSSSSSVFFAFQQQQMIMMASIDCRCVPSSSSHFVLPLSRLIIAHYCQFPLHTHSIGRSLDRRATLDSNLHSELQQTFSLFSVLKPLLHWMRPPESHTHTDL